MTPRKPRKTVPSTFKKLLQKEINSQCPFCANEEVHHFEIHHIDEDPANNEFTNLLMLCQICHSKITKGEISEREVWKIKLHLREVKRGSLEDFPGVELAKAWVYTVINELICDLEPQLKCLVDEDWGFDRFHPEQLKRINELTPGNIQGNYENFFQHQNEVFEILQSHDEKVRSVVSVAKISHQSISESAQLKELFESLTSLDVLINLKDEGNPHQLYEFRDCGTRDEFLKKLFGSMSTSEIMQLVAELLINNPEPAPYQNNFGPWWNLNYPELVTARASIFKKEIEHIQQSGLELLGIAEQLFSLLKNTRNSLCEKYRFPPDEPRQTVIQVPTYGSRYGRF